MTVDRTNVRLQTGGRRVVGAMLLVAVSTLAACDKHERLWDLWRWAKTKLDVFTRSSTPSSTPSRPSPDRKDTRSERYVAFESRDTYLVSGDTNHASDIFLYDRLTQETMRVSVGQGGLQANGGSFAPDVSGDGRAIVFESLATNLVPDDTNRQRDIFVHDHQARTTTRVSVESSGEQANSFSQTAHLSDDGRFVVFESLASNLVPGDTNGVMDIFVHDRLTRRTERVSVSGAGDQANNASVNPTISPDGRHVRFDSFATNLASKQAEGTMRTFVHDRYSGQTLLVSEDRQIAGGVTGRSTWR